MLKRVEYPGPNHGGSRIMQEGLKNRAFVKEEKGSTSGLPADRVEIGNDYEHFADNVDEEIRFLKKVAGKAKAMTVLAGLSSIGIGIAGLATAVTITSIKSFVELARKMGIKRAGTQRISALVNKIMPLVNKLTPIGIGLSGAYYSIDNIINLKKAIKEKNVTDGIEAGSQIAASGSALIESASGLTKFSKIAGFLGKTAVSAINSPLSLGIAGGLECAFGGLYSIVAAKHLIAGIKNKKPREIAIGALEAGASIASVASALGGGLPAGIAVGAFFTGKFIIANQEKIREFPQKLAKWLHKLMDMEPDKKNMLENKQETLGQKE